MFPSETLENHMRRKMSQELCNEIDAAFQLTERQAGFIMGLREEIATYRRMLNLNVDEPNV